MKSEVQKKREALINIFNTPEMKKSIEDKIEEI